MKSHERFMRKALAEAYLALGKGEVPIGAVVVCQGVIIGCGHNLRETLNDPTAHAEIIALRQAGEKLGTWRLSECSLYVTLEPCPMCAGALVQARIKELIYGADDPKAGAAGTLLNIPQFPDWNHFVKIISGILAEESQALLQGFWKDKRK
jgi:tRNA(adenine34) deaminase